jgi:hypothetical protein
MQCAPVPVECGNGILEDDETCECEDKTTACTACYDCQLDDGVECTVLGFLINQSFVRRLISERRQKKLDRIFTRECHGFLLQGLKPGHACDPIACLSDALAFVDCHHTLCCDIEGIPGSSECCTEIGTAHFSTENLHSRLSLDPTPDRFNCPLESGRCVTNGIPLGCPLLLLVHSVKLHPNTKDGSQSIRHLVRMGMGSAHKESVYYPVLATVRCLHGRRSTASPLYVRFKKMGARSSWCV